MANVLKTVTQAMTALWQTNPASPGVRNNGLFIGSAPAGVPPLFATWNILPPGKLMMTMNPGNTGTNIDDISIQFTCFADQKQGLGMCLDLFGYGDSLWHRQALTMTDVNLVGMYRIGSYISWWDDEEKLWQVASRYSVMAG